MAKNRRTAGQSLRIPVPIILAAKLLSLFSTRLTVRFAARLFTTPIKHRIPNREGEMDRASTQSIQHVESIDRNIVVYQYGSSEKKILLAHGWSGRGTQLVRIAEALLENGYSTISFDAPAHGKSEGSTTIMIEFIESILEIDKQFGPFEAAVGHSLGGMALLNAAKKGFEANSVVTIGSGDIIRDIMDDFIRQMKLGKNYSHLMRGYFEKKYHQSMDSFSSYIAAKEIDIPVLVIHDNDDPEVPVKCGIHIHKHLINGQLMLTKGLGHRKILGNPNVIETIIQFIERA